MSSSKLIGRPWSAGPSFARPGPSDSSFSIVDIARSPRPSFFLDLLERLTRFGLVLLGHPSLRFDILSGLLRRGPGLHLRLPRLLRLHPRSRVHHSHQAPAHAEANQDAQHKAQHERPHPPRIAFVFRHGP